MRKGVYLGWLGHQNLGDDGMFDACRRLMPGIDWAPPNERPLRTWRGPAALRGLRRRLAHLLDPEVGILGGGTILNRNREWLHHYNRLKERVRRPVPVFGAGVANPEFWSGVDGWEDLLPEWREALGDLPEIGVRGPISRRILEEAGFPNVRVVGDPALALHAARPPAPAPAGAIGVNVGRSLGLVAGGEDRLVSTVAGAIRRLADEGLDVRLFAVWIDDVPACVEVAREAGLDESAVVPFAADADELLRRLSDFEVVLSTKLHAAVFAATAGVPFVALEYRPKVRDFTESIGWTGFSHHPGAIDGARLAKAVMDLRADLDAARHRLVSRVDEMAATFREYAGRLEAQLLS